MKQELTMNTAFQKHIWIVFFFMLLSVGCAVKRPQVCERGGVDYGTTIGIFRDRWEDYYERALSYMEGECYQAALTDLTEAIRQNPEDQRMARTYGMHFMDYFPHREKGLVYYLTGDYESAERELSTSIEQYPSDKAEFYLNKVRKRLFEDRHAVSAPRIAVHAPSPVSGGSGEIRTSAHFIELSGEVWDDHFISGLAVNDEFLFLESASRRVPFYRQLRLGEGRSEIRITAENLLNKSSETSFIVHVDRTGPAVVIQSFEPGRKISGVVVDESEVTDFRLNGDPVPIEKGKTVSFSIPLTGKNAPMVFAATDGLGNETRIDLNGVDDMAAITDLTAQNSGFTATGVCPAVSDAFSGPLSAARLHKTMIQVSGWKDRDSTFLDSAAIKGAAKSKHGVVSLKINGKQIPCPGGQTILFDRTVLLKPGENQIDIETRDESGDTALKKIHITRRRPSIYDLKHRYGFIMRPFKKGRYYETDTEFIQHLLIQNLIDEQRFQIYLEPDLKTGLLKRNFLTHDESRFNGGTESGPDAEFTGTIYETRNGVEIVTRLIDPATSEILAIKDVYQESRDPESLNQMARNLTQKYIREFPLKEMRITECGERLFYFGHGEAPLKMGWPVLIFRAEKTGINQQPELNKGVDTAIIGKARIDELKPAACGARIIEKSITIQTGDGVIGK